jgi:four helix bundle protein
MGSNFKQEFKNRLYVFTLDLLKNVEKIPTDLVSKTLCNQLIRSGTSVLANYIEGQSASSRKELTNYLNISLKSANESKVWLSLLKDMKKLDAKVYESLIDELTQLSKILAASILSLKKEKEKTN